MDPMLRRSIRLRQKMTINQDSKTTAKSCLTEPIVSNSQQVIPAIAPSPSIPEMPTRSSRATSRTSEDSGKTKRIEELKAQLKRKEMEIHEHHLQQQKLELELNLAETTKNKGESVGSEVSVESAQMYSQRSNIEKWVRDTKSKIESASCQSLYSVYSSDSFKTRNRSHSLRHHHPNHEYKEEYEYTNKDIARILTRNSMPKELPSFTGNPIEWPNFIAQFNNSTKICGFTNEENQCRLQKCLKGTARKVVESLLIMPENVSKVIQTLERRFGQPEHIIFLLLDKIKKLSPVKEEKLNSLIEFADEVRNLVATIQSLKENDHLRNPILMQELVNKLPITLRMSWIEYMSTIPTMSSKLEEFQLWLERKAGAACKLHLPTFDYVAESSKFKNRNVTLTTKDKTQKICDLCKQKDHTYLNKCAEFKSYEVDKRWEYVVSKKICFSCLLPFHTIKECRRRKVCGINGCKKPHNELLHKNIEFKPTVDTTNCHIFKNQVLLKIVPVTVKSANHTLKTYALLDDASTISLIDENLAKKLKLDGPEEALCMQWTTNETREQKDSKVVSFTIKGITENCKEFQLRHVRTIRGLALPSQHIRVPELIKKYPYLDENKMNNLQDVKPLILIGQDNWPLIINRKIISGPWKGPVLSKTLLGWVIHGNISANNKTHPYYKSVNYNTVCHITQQKDDLDILQEMIKQQWKIDNVDGKATVSSNNELAMSQEDKRAQEILNKTMRRVGMRIETGLLWKNKNATFPDTKMTALQRLKCTERKMDKDPEYANAYCEKIEDMLKKNYIRKLTPEEINTVPRNQTWYLPHFGIINPNKKKLRIVFDASAKTDGVCLNDFLLTGPDLYQSQYAILLNFRIKNIAFVADIKEMFLQVLVRQEDRRAQRFLWRGKERDNNKEPDVYEFNVVFFGSTSGPCLAQAAKNKNAEEFINEYPDAVTAILEDHYMDDYLGGADNENEAIKLINNIIFVHRQGGFNICNWISNSKKVLSEIDPELRANMTLEKEMNKDDITATERILGLWWNPRNDTFTYRSRFHKVDSDVIDNRRKPTKREVLKVIMSVFDPLGFLGNFMIQGKILLQEIWRSEIGWDDQINDNLYNNWENWLSNLRKIGEFRLNRQYFTSHTNERYFELHVFCDASELAYAAVAYLRLPGTNNEATQVKFVMAKTRVTPLKPVSIPRLELQAALTAAHLASWLRKVLKVKISRRVLWTDSKTVLHWLKSEARRYKVFVAQRVGEIQELTNVKDWRYVPSKENVADEATRRTEKDIIFTDSRWINGPAFLKETEESWPQENMKDLILETVNLEERNDYVLVHNDSKIITPVIPEPLRFSKWNRLLRTTAWMLKFIRKCKKKYNSKNCELLPAEINAAENLLLRRCQTDTFHTEITILLKDKENLPHSSRLFNLPCTMGNDGLVRLKGRINNSSEMSYLAKEPVILDPRHDITKLILQHYHESAFHQGIETVINLVRQKYWILRLRQALKSTISKCQHCKNEKTMPQVPIMGQLPSCRLEKTIRPFIKTGIDYFGPIEITIKRSHEKRYGVIFTCMATRAIHLDISHDLSTGSFIHVFRQFGCRRGFPEEIYSDNGTNFKGAEAELKKVIENLNQEEITNFWSMHNCKWYFNPPVTPHMGGSWERLIRSVKKILKEILTEKYPQEHVLRTVLAEAENIINCRPLTHCSTDPRDNEPLTPNHFLIGLKNTALPCAQIDETNLNLNKHWKATQKLLNIFWQRWVQEYLPTLVKSSKWNRNNRNVRVGDIVLVVDPNGPRNVWLKGVVEKTFPGKDGKTRAVDVRTKLGVYRRPVIKICVLDVKEKENSVE